MRWHCWLRHYATRRKVAGSIPDGVSGIFNWHKTSGRLVALGSTQPLIEMSTRNISLGGKGGLTTFMCRMYWNLGTSTTWNPVQACTECLNFLSSRCDNSSFFLWFSQEDSLPFQASTGFNLQLLCSTLARYLKVHFMWGCFQNLNTALYPSKRHSIYA